MITALFALLLLYAALVVLLYLSQSHLLYFPSRKLVATPAATGLLYTPVSFHADDGTPLSGWFVPTEHSTGVVLFFHGNGGNISYLLDTIEQYHALGLDVFVFDYRGYGESGGRPTEQGTYRDAEAAWQYLTLEKQRTPSTIILIGRSLGGAVAARLAQTVKPRALVLESSFTSVPDIAARAYPLVPARLLSRFRYATKQYLQNVHCPVLVVHSPQDEIIPFDHGQDLYAAAHEPKKFLQIGGGHNEAYFLSHQKYSEGLQKFLANYPTRTNT
jgi:alpha-beta hydrolase superfamily lysophospholipase